MKEPAPNQNPAARADCLAFDLNVLAFLEGENRPEVTRHAAACPYCKVLLADLQLISTAGRDVTLSEPPARVWANIRAALAEEGIIHARPSFWQRWFPIANLAPEARPVGALLALAAMALVLIGSIQNYETSRPSDKMAHEGAVITAGFVPPGMSPAFVETVRQMEGTFRAQENSFEPAMQATFKKSLEALDASIEESWGQCQRNPSDLLARQYLVDAYQTKAEVLASALESAR